VANSLLCLLAIAAGAGMAIQVVVNAQLRTHVAEPMLASLISFAVGTAAAFLYCLFAGYAWPSFQQLREAPWWAWIGGLLGLFFIWCSIVIAPRIGVALMLGLVVAGQVAASTIIDHYGMLGAAVRPASFGRIAGVILVVVGVSLVAAYRE
jgi:bacterial/archaeal transporter family-2 protein